MALRPARRLPWRPAKQSITYSHRYRHILPQSASVRLSRLGVPFPASPRRAPQTFSGGSVASCRWSRFCRLACVFHGADALVGHPGAAVFSASAPGQEGGLPVGVPGSALRTLGGAPSARLEGPLGRLSRFFRAGSPHSEPMSGASAAFGCVRCPRALPP
ncbi:MAG: hypothetical protein M2R45_04691 [Verrucomicrobia subdivision 3 bacterium]|nr:hypothetical protein [Limisphaerales bacterium]MCS1416286.1 hypothetical protein [Limisphaerales bacterium]